MKHKFMYADVMIAEAVTLTLPHLDVNNVKNVNNEEKLGIELLN